MKFFTASALLFATAAKAMNLRGGTGGVQEHIRMLDTTNYTNIALCAHTNEDCNNDKYFWLSLIKEKDNGDVEMKGSCLLEILGGTPSDTLECCVVSNITQYSTNYDLTITDPHHLKDNTTAGYDICGREGGYGCPTYDYDNNEQGFTYYEVQDKDGNELQKMDKFVCDKDCDGLTHEAGYAACDDICYIQVYEHSHIGKSYCNAGAVTLSKTCDGHYGYKCTSE